MLKRKFSVLISVILTLVMTVSAFAAFSDVGENYSWAQEAIEEMSAKGIINGYPDGTFKPASGITRIQAMLLISRILGYVDETYAPYIKTITESNSESLSGIKLDYVDEISFLIYKGVFTPEEIKDYSVNMNQQLMRYEVAMYLTKAMGQYENVGKSGSSETGYADEDNIPDSYKPYVKYVKDAGLMQGTSAENFSPLTTVTRAQMAVMLFRIINKLNLSIFEAGYKTVVDTDGVTSIEVELAQGINGSYEMTDAALYINGKEEDISKLAKGDRVILVFEDGNLRRIEKIVKEEEQNTPPPEDEAKRTINVKINEVILSASNYLTVVDSTDGETKRFYLRDDCKATVDGKPTTLSGVRAKDHAEITLDKNEEVLLINVIDMVQTIKNATVKSISTDNNVIVTIELSDGTEKDYLTANNVAVKRNNAEATLADVLAGDSISTATLTYDRLSALEVKSVISNTSGSISEIVISRNSSIVIADRNKDTRYAVGNGIKITVDGEDAEIYDLRLGMNASVTLDGSTITKITVTSVADVGQLTGQIKVVNTSYGFVTILTPANEEKQVFINASAHIIDNATGKTKSLSGLSVGDNIVVVGKTVNGAFQASTIIVVAD